MRALWTLIAACAMAVAARAAPLKPPDDLPLTMRVGEQRIVLGALAEHVTAAQPERLRTVRLPGLGIHLRALAPGEATLIWGMPPRLFARIHIDPAAARDQ